MGLQWKHEFEVNVAEVDIQHKKLIELIGDLDKCLSRRGEKETLIQTMAVLTRYVQHHFASEEKLMVANGYPEVEKHRKEHDVMMNIMVEFNRKFDRDAIELSTSILSFMEERFVSHVLRMDKPMGEYLSAARVAA